MTFEALANAIRGRFHDLIEVGESVSVEYDNGPAFTPTVGTKWIRFSIREGDSVLAEIGSPKTFRTVGVAIAQIFTPIDQGDKDALELADTIKEAFRAVSITGLKFRTPSLRRVGRTDNWYQVNLNCPFHSDDVEGA